MAAAISIFHLFVSINNKKVLSDINLELAKGKIIGLLGPSGAGKTTLIRTLLGLQKSTSGSVTVLGLRPGAKKLRPQIGYVSQAPSVYFDLSVKENIYYFASLLGNKKPDIDSVLREVELYEYKDRIVGSLSGGQRARVSLAVALLGHPAILLLDEPTVGLDPVLRQKLWGLFRQLADSGVTLLVSSHVMDEAEKCDELIFLRNGKLLISGSKHDVLNTTGASSMENAFLALAETAK